MKTKKIISQGSCVCVIAIVAKSDTIQLRTAKYLNHGFDGSYPVDCQPASLSMLTWAEQFIACRCCLLLFALCGAKCCYFTKQHSRDYRNAAGPRCNLNLNVLSNGLRRILSGPGQCSRRGLGSWWQEKTFLPSFLDSFPPVFFQTCSVAAPGKFYFRCVSQRALDTTRCKAGTFLLWGIRHCSCTVWQARPVWSCDYLFAAGLDISGLVSTNGRLVCRLGFKEASDSWALETKDM